MPSVVDEAEDPVGTANVNENEEQARRSVEDPFKVGVVGYRLVDDWFVEKVALLATNMPHYQTSIDGVFNTLFGPPELLDSRMRCKHAMIRKPIHGGIESPTTVRENRMIYKGTHMASAVGVL